METPLGSPPVNGTNGTLPGAPWYVSMGFRILDRYGLPTLIVIALGAAAYLGARTVYKDMRADIEGDRSAFLSALEQHKQVEQRLADAIHEGNGRLASIEQVLEDRLSGAAVVVAPARREKKTATKPHDDKEN